MDRLDVDYNVLHVYWTPFVLYTEEDIIHHSFEVSSLIRRLLDIF